MSFTQICATTGEALLDALLDTLKLLPFLFLTYLLMEFLEHTAGERTQNAIGKAGRFGPLAGAALGLLPQCGFSAAAAGLYAGRVVTLGTLFAVFFATSDEMIPVLIGEAVPWQKILTVLGVKFAVAILVGFAVDFIFRRRAREMKVVDLCETEHCHCEKGILRSALHHTLHISLFILTLNALLGLAFAFVGEERIGEFLSLLPWFDVVFAALLGLVPNCAASVAIATMWTRGVLSGGAMIGGLLTGAGTGYLVLFRTNHHKKENILIAAAALALGVAFGLIFDLTGLAALLGL